jgi:hypothetical protein
MLLVGVAGCPKTVAVWIAPESRAEKVQFAFGREAGHERPVIVGVLRVNHCSRAEDVSEALWLITSPSARVTRVTYGQLPAGFVEEKAPEGLKPGCYVATISGSPGRVYFEIGPSGEVRQLDGKPA